MKRISKIIATERLVLRTWCQDDLDDFAKMHADPFVMRDLGGPISLIESRAKLSRYISMYENFGFSRYCVVDLTDKFVGYVGICPRSDDQIIGEHNEIGWRLNKDDWGKGYATEAGRACMVEFNCVHPASEIISYTTVENIRSQNVMSRLNMERVPLRDFQWREPDGNSTEMLVWVSSQAS